MNIKELKKTIKENKIVIIKFYTETCGVCKMYEKEFLQAQKHFKDIKFLSVDINEKDEFIDFAASYDVFGAPTTTIIINNNLVENILGFKTFEELNIIITNLIK